MKPIINVTPLIDILLVLLIIFMVISPIKSSQFETRIPSESKGDPGTPNPLALIVRINSDETLGLNNENDLGTINDPSKLSFRLNQIFGERLKNGSFNENLIKKENLSVPEKVQKTVFIKAPKSISYGQVVKIIDEIKVVGANPISLQIDDLER